MQRRCKHVSKARGCLSNKPSAISSSRNEKKQECLQFSEKVVIQRAKPESKKAAPHLAARHQQFRPQRRLIHKARRLR
uniref:Uncharacterized protein n=1 Tax=Romanomermis culicivorax TaxID=13658 RepID=A0A915I707_ROMCU